MLTADPNCCRIPPMARFEEARAYVWSRSTMTMRPVKPSCRRWYPMLDPTTPPPTMTTSAVSIDHTAVPTRAPKRDARGKLAHLLAHERDDEQAPQAAASCRSPDS